MSRQISDKYRDRLVQMIEGDDSSLRFFYSVRENV